VEDWFTVLEDLLVAVRLPVFCRRARREPTTHPKFFLFDAGVFRAVRPRGPLDSTEELDGAALETLLFQEIRAYNDLGALGYALSHWRTRAGDEVDLVLYGERGLLAFEVKRSSVVRPFDLRGLRVFREEFPPARLFLVDGGEREYLDDGITILPFAMAILRLLGLLLGEEGG
jgi:predicted AAA+ superfamily ATPase